ncbi:MAG: serine/threonine-protein kinase, partial [Streptosporangiaceae bacterium]
MSFEDSTQLLFAGRYQLERPIGSGRTSTVWRAWDETLGRTVAVKVVSVALLPDVLLRARLLEQTRLAAALRHPGLPAIYDFGEASVPGGRDTPFIVMEHLQGESLAARLARGILDRDEASGVCGAVANALAIARDAGLVHHDVRPSKIFLAEDGVRLLGLGTGLPFAAGQEPVVSPYTAPEQREATTGTGAADVYALGIVLAEATTGRLPGEDSLSAELPDGIAQLCARCWAEDPRDRPTATEMAEILANPVPAKPPVFETTTALKEYPDQPPQAADLIAPRPPRRRPPTRRQRARRVRRVRRVVLATLPVALIVLL